MKASKRAIDATLDGRCHLLVDVFYQAEGSAMDGRGNIGLDVEHSVVDGDLDHRCGVVPESHIEV